MKSLAFLCVWIPAAFAQYVPGHYIVELTEEPAIAHGAKAGARAAIEARRPAVLDQQKAARRDLERLGAKVYGSADTVANALFVRIKDSDAEKLKQASGVKSVRRARRLKAHLDRALALSHVPDGWNLIGGAASAGVGIKVGIIDTGIDVTNPALQDSTLAMPDGFPLVNKTSDMQFTSSKVIVARSYDNPDSFVATDANDTLGHGTLVAMAAAGVNTPGQFGPVSGVAPRAWVGNYKVFPDDLDGGAVDTIILQAIDDAVKDGMNVINLSLGVSLASRPSDDTFALAVERAVKAGVMVSTSAGNDGPDPFTLSTPSIAPSAISACNTLSDRSFLYPLTVDGVNQPYSAVPGNSVNDGDPAVTGPLADVAALDGVGEACKALPAGSLQGNIALILRGNCTFEVKLNNAAAAGAIAGIVYTQAGNTVDLMDTGSATLPAVMISNADGLDLKSKIASGQLHASLSFTLARIPVDPNGIEPHSSRGPGFNGQIKPELCATGTDVYFPIPGGFEYATGTSISSPLIAGAAAVLEAARPGLTTAQYRSLLINTASPVNLKGDSTTPLAIRDGGAGLLNLVGVLSGTVAASPATLEFGVSTGTARRSLTLTLTNVGSASDTYSVTVTPMTGASAPAVSVNSVALDSGKSQDISVTLDGAGLAPGEYSGYVVVQGTASAQVARIPYWYGVPLDTPKHLTILYEPVVMSRNSVDDVVFRITDAIGVPSTVKPTVTLASGTGLTLKPLQSIDSDVPGAWDVELDSARLRGDNVIHITAGDLQVDVTVTVQ